MSNERLHTFLNAAAGEGLVLDGIDAGDLYAETFPERYAAAQSADSWPFPASSSTSNTNEPCAKTIVMMAGAILDQPEGTADNRHPDWPQAVKQAERAYRASLVEKKDRRIAELERRLEIDPKAKGYDGIETRDATIREQDKVIEQQRARIAALEGALQQMVDNFEPHAWGSSENKADALREARAALSELRAVKGVANG